MDYDALLPAIGEFGRYQKVLIGVILFPTVFPCAFQAYSQLFIASTPDHWCRIPELQQWNTNNTDLVKQLSIPSTIHHGRRRYDRCSMFDRNYTEINIRFPELTGSEDNVNLSTVIISCKDGWNYDVALYPATVVTEFDLVCDKGYYSTFSLVIFGAGGLIGNYIFGYLQDHWGRKPSYFTYLFIQIAAGVFSAFSWNFESWIIFRTLVGLTIPAILTSPYVIAFELVDPTKRPLCTIVLNIAYSVGLVTLAGVVYLFRFWRYLSLAVVLPFLLLFIGYPLIPESPRWLISVGKYGRAQRIMEKIARANGKTLPEDFPSHFKPRRESSEDQKRTSYGIMDLFRTPKLRRNTIIITFIWFANTSVYVGLSYYAPSLKGDEILNFFLGGLVELPTYLFLWPSLRFFGRRWILMSSMMIGGVACLSTVLFQEDQTVTLLLYCIGKIGISTAWVVLPLVAAELYPTVIRGLGLNFSSVVAMVGPVLIPIVNYMGTDMVALPLMINGVVLMLGGLASLILPETKDKPLPDSICQIESA